MINVAVVLPSFAGGGAERVMITIANSLDPARFASRLILLDNAGPLAALVGAHVPVTPLGQPRLRRALPALRRALVAEPTDVAITTIGYLNVGMLMVRPFLPRQIRLIVREANIPLSGTGRRTGRALGLATRMLYPRADRVLCPARVIADDLVARFGLRPERVTIIPNPVDTLAIRNLAVPPIREPGPGLRLVAAGRLVEQKGFDRLLAILPQLPIDTHLSILGEGPLHEALAAKATELGLAERVHFAGFQANPWRVYAGADAFVLTSLWEGQSNAALEALACGTPVVATPEAGGIAELAGLCAPGAVSVVSMGAEFAVAVAAKVHNDPGSMRPSLAPPNLTLPEIVDRYARVITEISER